MNLVYAFSSKLEPVHRVRLDPSQFSGSTVASVAMCWYLAFWFRTRVAWFMTRSAETEA